MNVHLLKLVGKPRKKLNEIRPDPPPQKKDIDSVCQENKTEEDSPLLKIVSLYEYKNYTKKTREIPVAREEDEVKQTDNKN